MNVQVGSYSGNSTDNRAITSVGFAPDLVIIKGDTSQKAVWKSATLIGDNTLDLQANTDSFSNGIQSLDSDGFTLGTDARVNSSGVTYYWIAFKEASSNFKEASYTGDATDSRSITGVGFQPTFIFLRRNGTDAGVLKSNQDSGQASRSWAAADYPTNKIQALEADGFQIGTDTEVNGNTFTYIYAAFADQANKFDTGSYTGNGVDDRSITGVGFQPNVVVVKRASGTEQEAVMRTSSMSGDTSVLMSSAASNVTDRIQALEADGFQVGTNAQVNSNGETYHWYAWLADVSGTTISTTTTTSTSTTTTSTSTSTTTTSTSTTRTTSSTSTTTTSTSTTSTSTSTTTTSTSTTTSSSTSTSTTTTLDFFFTIEEV